MDGLPCLFAIACATAGSEVEGDRSGGCMAIPSTVVLVYRACMKTQKSTRVWGREIGAKDMKAVFEWCNDEINLVELMAATKANTSSVYSLIARALREAIQKGLLKRSG